MSSAKTEIPPALRPLHAQIHLAIRREEWVGDAVAAALGHDAISVLATARRSHPVSLPEWAGDVAALGQNQNFYPA